MHRIVLFLGLWTFFLPLGQAEERETKAKENKLQSPVAGQWNVVSTIENGKVSPAVDHHGFFVGETFVQEWAKERHPLAIFRPKQLYELKWIQDGVQPEKWTACLHHYPHSSLGIPRLGKETEVSFATLWVNGKTGVLVLSDQKVELDSYADIRRLDQEAGSYRVLSLSREADLLWNRLEMAGIRVSGYRFGHRLSPVEMRELGGWYEEALAGMPDTRQWGRAFLKFPLMQVKPLELPPNAPNGPSRKQPIGWGNGPLAPVLPSVPTTLAPTQTPRTRVPL